jgi:hypothetical protein
MNNRVSNMEPCGTPEGTGKSEKDFPKVRTTENLVDK